MTTPPDHPMLEARIREGSQDANRGLAALTRAGSALDLRTAELVKVRVSQINGCGYCVDLHVRKALEDAAEDPRRLAALPAWREVPFFDARERAALALAEAMTVPPLGPLSADVVDGAKAHFAGDDLTPLMAVIVSINAWNRVMIAEGAQAPALAGD